MRVFKNRALRKSKSIKDWAGHVAVWGKERYIQGLGGKT